MTGAAPARRVHDARASRRALLQAASRLFDERGYDNATLREIGARAGVDPALVARYFGGKEGLYLAVLADEEHTGPMSEDPDPRTVLGMLLERWDERGLSPISRALVSPVLSASVRKQVHAVLDRRVLEPLEAELRRRGVADARVRAELLVALVLGLCLARSNGTLEALAAAPRAELRRLLTSSIDALVDPAQNPFHDDRCASGVPGS